MVGGAVARPAATPEPDVKPFDRLRAGFSLHPALQITGSCDEYPSTALRAGLVRWTSS